MGELEEKLLAAMLACGASSDLARIHAADFAALLAPKIERERRDQQIAELFPRAGYLATAERFGVHPATAYRALERFSRKCKALAKGSG